MASDFFYHSSISLSLFFQQNMVMPLKQYTYLRASHVCYECTHSKSTPSYPTDRLSIFEPLICKLTFLSYIKQVDRRIPSVPHRTFHNFKASKFVDLGILRGSKTLIDVFQDSVIAKCSVGTYVFTICVSVII